MKKRWQKWTLVTQEREYPENWVGKFIESNGEFFDYGLDFTECAVLKFLQKQGGMEVAPYICLSDYAKMKAINVGFKRTQTLASGGKFCDFRFIKDYETPNGWPPEQLEEFKPSEQG